MYKYYANYYEDFAITCNILENNYTLATETNSDLNIHYIDFDKKRENGFIKIVIIQKFVAQKMDKF